MMLIVRFLTGFADGPIYPLMTSVLKVQGDPKRFASYIGLTQFSIGVIAMILGPTLTIQLALTFGLALRVYFYQPADGDRRNYDLVCPQGVRPGRRRSPG